MYSGGSGTALDPYLIGTPQDLIDIKNNLSSYFLFVSDIDLSSYSDWEPVGWDTGEITGEIDGNGYVVKNVNFVSDHGETSSLLSFGLFDSLEDGVIKNIGVENISVSYSGAKEVRFGGVVARAFGTSLATIEKCYTTGNVDLASTVDFGVTAGGIVGTCGAGSVSIKNCWSDVLIECSSVPDDTKVSLGGICGAVRIQSSETTTIENCYALGDIVGFGTAVSLDNVLAIGGICGKTEATVSGFVVQNCSANMTSLSTNGTDSLYVNRIVTKYKSATFSTTPSVTTTNNYALDVMNTPNTPVSDANGVDGLDKTLAQLKQQLTYETGLGWDFDDIWLMGDKYPFLKAFIDFDSGFTLFFGTNF